MSKIDTSTEAVTKLLDGVTPGPWRIKDCESAGYRCANYHQEIWNEDTDILVTTEVTRAHNDGGAKNMRFIRAARDLVPALLAERDALRKERDSAQRRHAEADATIAAAEAIIAVAETAEAERDALRRENENLRQIERNVQAVREHEYKRAEAALAEVERLKSQSVTVQDAAKVPEVQALIEAAYKKGLSDALGIVASIGYGATEDVDRGHEDAYRAIEKHLADWKASAAAALRAIVEGKV